MPDREFDSATDMLTSQILWSLGETLRKNGNPKQAAQWCE